MRVNSRLTLPVQLVIATRSELEALITGGVYDPKKTREEKPRDGPSSEQDQPEAVEDSAHEPDTSF